ncbi:shiftless antiviral inhibitor of ribosomal frameshifting protein homolog [Myxocyprinus asiaticus]|uniref:shiftless antiviral inhibitor of ribosomal frameshifting protein homolog n=1 Tax=Myxocyprinus asiaticus TaxID=70543 RepID=UPI0022223029|nr:shiftless antiviral inhibitor of ribosomal frameshifting protein homolog [Myxocyprinus asiaticus]
MATSSGSKTTQAVWIQWCPSFSTSKEIPCLYMCIYRTNKSSCYTVVLHSISLLLPQAKENPNDDKDIAELGACLRVLELTEENKCMFDQAQANQIPAVIHQFACESCDRDWWRRVPQRKRVRLLTTPVLFTQTYSEIENKPHVPGTERVHPRSRQKNRKPRVVYPSHAHISSGSTVNTCLSQGSLLDSLNELILDDIKEESVEESDSSS